MKLEIAMIKEYYNYIILSNNYDGFLKLYPDFDLKLFIKYTRTVDLPFICLMKFSEPKYIYEKMLLKDNITKVINTDYYTTHYDFIVNEEHYKEYKNREEKNDWKNICDKIELDYDKCFCNGNKTPYFNMLINTILKQKITDLSNCIDYKEPKDSKIILDKLSRMYK